jgi:pimeloyl-ACP methyl ester carboxylesterase
MNERLRPRLFCLVFLCAMAVPLSASADAAFAGASDCRITTKSEPIGGGTIVYNVVGTGPSILLLHGLFAAKEQWDAIACQLAAAGFQALAVDLPGYGKSQGFALPDYRLGSQAELLRQLTMRLGIDRLDIAGSSMGGAIASIYAGRYRRQVRSLAFIGSPLGIIEWDRGVRKAISHGINPFIPINSAQFELELRLLFVNPPTIPVPEKKAIIADYIARNRHYVQVWDIVNLYDQVLARETPRSLPAMIVWGTADQIYAIDGADRLQRQLPRSVVRKLPDAGHLLLVENPDEAVSAYLGFLRGCCAGARQAANSTAPGPR